MEKDLHSGIGYELLLLVVLEMAVALIPAARPTLELVTLPVWLRVKEELALSWRDCTEAGMNALALYDDLRSVALTWSNIASIAGLGSNIIPMLNYLSVALHRVNRLSEEKGECEVRRLMAWSLTEIGAEVLERRLELFA